MRGTDQEGNSANFVETEQIVEFDRDYQQSKRCLASFLQVFFFKLYIRYIRFRHNFYCLFVGI